jgi:hypothetical protein
MLRPLSVNEIQQKCSEHGLSISSALVERIQQVFSRAVETYDDQQSERSRNPDSHYVFDAAIQKFAGCPQGSRNLDRPEALSPVEVRGALKALHTAKVALSDIGFRRNVCAYLRLARRTTD